MGRVETARTTTRRTLTCGSNTVTIKVDPSRTPTVATSSNRAFCAPDPDPEPDPDAEGATDRETRTGASSRGVTRPLVRASSSATSRRNHSTDVSIFASARAYSSRAAGSVNVCCELGVREAVAIGARFFDEPPPPVCDDGDSDSASAASGMLLFFRPPPPPPPFWRCFALEAYARTCRALVVVGADEVANATGREVIVCVMDRRRLWRRSDNIFGRYPQSDNEVG